MAAKKKTPAKKKPALKKKPVAKTARKAAPAKKSAARKPAGKKAAGKRPAGRTSKRPSASRKIAAKKVAAKRAPKENRGPKAVKVHEAPEALALARSIAQVAEEKKAEGVMIIDVRARSAAVGYDYVVLATGESDRQLSAIHEGVEDLLDPTGKKPAAVEASTDWVCVTYDEGVVAHFFTPDRRDQMDLEDLWKDAPRVSL